MSLELCILGSGSAGNATVVRSAAGGHLLIDCGIGPRAVAKRLDGTGVSLGDINAICLTHLDSDHFNANWVATLARQRIYVFAHTPYAHRLRYLYPDLAPLIVPFHAADFSPLSGVTFRPLPFAHDDSGSHGFLMTAGGCRVGYATDLGRVPQHMLEAFSSLDILAIEANYDPAMQMTSSRPYFLKQRIMGGSGHLSNQQAYDCVRLILARHEAAGRPLPSHIVLLHRSRQCNCPDLQRTFFERDARIAPRLTLAHQGERTAWIRVTERVPVRNEQLSIAFG